jgi:hypothetical protein
MDKLKGDGAKVMLMQDRNPLLAHLSLTQALNQLRKELRNYQKDIAPFDRKLRDNETVLDWWTVVQHDDDAHILEVIVNIPKCNNCCANCDLQGPCNQVVLGAADINAGQEDYVNDNMA